MKGNRDRTSADLAAIPSNPDVDIVHMAWRDAVYDQWNNVFYDVGKFLPQACTRDLCHWPPASEVLPLGFPDDSEGVMKVWDEGVLLIPAFLKPSVLIRVTIVQGPKLKKKATDNKGTADSTPDTPVISGDKSAEMQPSNDSSSKQQGVTLGVFDTSNPYEVWYIKKGAIVRFHVETDGDAERKGFAALMAYGLLCEMNDEERMQREIESSQKNVMMLFQQHRAMQAAEGLSA
ncbi:MAG: hypothetical protein Q9166_006155 [cf. Caloplaca sp. 2 TL-2023]